MCNYNNNTYIFNTDNIIKFDTTNNYYTIITNSPYNINHPVSMSGYNNVLYIFYIDNNLIRCTSYDLNNNTWSMNAYVTMQQSTTSYSQLGSYLINSKIYVTPKYDESSIPAQLILYVYDITINSWDKETVDTCGNYNLSITRSMLSYNNNYLYILERYSRLLHKINITSKQDTQLIVKTETEHATSSILYNNILYIYYPNSNTLESINISTGSTHTLASPTLKPEDSIPVQNTTLSTDNSYLYLSMNKGVQWSNTTYLYQYDTGNNTWDALITPKSGSIKFFGNIHELLFPSNKYLNINMKNNVINMDILTSLVAMNPMLNTAIGLKIFVAKNLSTCNGISLIIYFPERFIIIIIKPEKNLLLFKIASILSNIYILI